jgi:antitoxin ParD1/3/4
MANETMNIALPETMKAFVLEQVAAGGYSTASEYVRELIRADQRRKVQERVDAMLLAGLDSGKMLPVTPESWHSLRAAAAAQLKKSRRK